MSLKTLIANVILRIFPPTRAFHVKRMLLSRLGIRAAAGSCFCGGVAIFGGRDAILEVGESAWIGINCRFYLGSNGGVVIGSATDIGPEVSFVLGTHQIAGADRRAGRGYLSPISIGAGSWIGARVTILGGAAIGKGSIVGAGALVLPGSYPDNAILVGVPAKMTRVLESTV